MRTKCVVVAVLTASLPARADDPCAVDPPVAEPAVEISPPSTLPLRGKLRQKTDGQPLVGGTVTASAIGKSEVHTAISDENGDYLIHVSPGKYTITVYYLELTKEIATNIVIANQLDVGDTLIDDSKAGGGGCVFWSSPGPELTAQPYFGLTLPRNRAPVSRDRTHLASVALVTDVRTTVTTLERGVRLHGAPGIPTIFVDETGVSTMRAEITQATGSGGATDVSLRSGSNETRAETRLVLGLDRTADRTDRMLAQEAIFGGPIAKDKAWITFGLAADADRHAHGLLRFNFAATSDHQGEVIALAQDAGTARDGWVQGRWTSRFLDHRLKLQAIATAERLDLEAGLAAHAGVPGPVGFDRVQRAGGTLDLTYHHKALAGNHTLVMLAAAGAGSIERSLGIEGERHGDLSLAAGDSWWIRPNVHLDVGARSDTRTFAGERTTVVSPRVSLGYDFTREGRSDLFLAYQRVPHVDDGFLGEWRGGARFHDELAAGISHLPEKTPSLMVGIAGRAQRREDTDDLDGGLDGWVRIEKRRTFVHVAASTLRRAASLHAQRTLHKSSRHELAAATTVRTMQIDAEGHVVTEGGGALAWSWRSSDITANRGMLGTTIEMYDGTRGPGARLVLGGTW